MTYNEYLNEVRKTYLARVKYRGCRNTGLCASNSVTSIKLSDRGSTHHRLHRERFEDALDKACDGWGWLDSVWSLNSTHGLGYRQRDTKRQRLKRIVAARLNFIEAQRDR